MGYLLICLPTAVSVEFNHSFKVEKELRKLIEVWQKENETFFSVNGEKYLELIQVQQENRKREKKMAKLGKVRISS